MKVLVGYATAAGSTAGIADWNAGALQAHGHDVVVRSVDEVRGRALRGKPLWLFSFGCPAALRSQLRRWAAWSEAGVVSAETFGWFAALMFQLVGGRFGDFRDWAEIERWSASISDVLAGIEATRR